MAEEFRAPFQQSYQIGVLLAANAIRDAYLIVDGPNCTLFRTSHVQGNHDWNSDLLRVDGFHRVADTDATTERLAVGDDRLLDDRLLRAAERPDCGLVLLSAMSPAAITGRQYDRHVRETRQATGKPVVFVPNGSLTADWLTGYATTLSALAAGLPLDADGPPRPERIGLVGHLMHRNEADLQADVAELKRMLEALDLEVSGCWLDGREAQGLKETARAGTLISLPYGGDAARVLAARTGAQVVDCALPLGLEGCRGFLERVAAATNRNSVLEQAVDAEVGLAARRLQWMLPHSLLGRRVALIGDPHLVSAMAGAVEEFGCQVVLSVFWAHAAAVLEGERDISGKLSIDPCPEELSQLITEAVQDGGLDLVVCNAHALGFIAQTIVRHGIPFVEWGFPSYYTHSFAEAACLGTRGTLKLAERLANALSYQAIWNACRDRRP